MNKKAQLKKLPILLTLTIVLGVILVSAIFYLVGDVANSFEPTFPLNESTVPNHFTLLNVTVNITGNLDVRIFANSNKSRLNLQDSLVFHTLNASQNISYDLTTIPIQPDDEGLVALYHFDNLSEFGENSTYVYDFAGLKGINNGTVVGATWNETGKIAGAYEFDGDDDNIQVPDSDSLNIPINITISAWFKPIGRGESGVGRILRKQLSYDIFINDDDDAIKFTFFNQSIDFINPIIEDCYVMNEWNNLVVTLNSSTMTPYCNGVKREETSWIGGTINETRPIFIGSDQANGNNFNGTIDEVASYNISLKSTEIQEIYQLQIDKYY